MRGVQPVWARLSWFVVFLVSPLVIAVVAWGLHPAPEASDVRMERFLRSNVTALDRYVAHSRTGDATWGSIPLTDREYAIQDVVQDGNGNTYIILEQSTFVTRGICHQCSNRPLLGDGRSERITHLQAVEGGWFLYAAR